MYYDSFDVWWWPFAFILLSGILPTAVWRWAGVFARYEPDDAAAGA